MFPGYVMLMALLAVWWLLVAGSWFLVGGSSPSSFLPCYVAFSAVFAWVTREGARVVVFRCSSFCPFPVSHHVTIKSPVRAVVECL